jgi:hypothetical protein
MNALVGFARKKTAAGSNRMTLNYCQAGGQVSTRV